MQVLGLTNYSNWRQAAAVRECMQSFAPAQQLLSSLALKQLQQFVHVGVMDLLDESIAALAVCIWHEQLAKTSMTSLHCLTLPCNAVLHDTVSAG